MKTGRKLLNAAVSASALSLIALAAQFAVRVAMTSSLGASAEYDAFLAAMIPAALIATVGFQAAASALMPKISDMITSGHPRAAAKFHRSAVLKITLLSIPFSLLIFAAFEAGGFGQPLLIGAVLLGWGMIAGVNTLQRQILTYFDRFHVAVGTALIPSLTLLMTPLLIEHPQAVQFALFGLAGQILSLVTCEYTLWNAWRAAFHESGPEMRGAIPSLWPILAAALPILGASFNAQAMSIIDQTMAAWFSVGGLALLSIALAVARLPHTVADSATMASCYRGMLDAVARVRANRSAENKAMVGKSFQQMFEIQSLIIAPSAIGILLCSGAIVEILFQRGKFGAEEAGMAAAILAVYPLAAFGTMMQGVQVQIFVALGRSADVLKYELALTAFSALLNIAFLPFFGLPGLVLSTGVSITIVALLIFRRLTQLDIGIGKRIFLEGLKIPALSSVSALALGAAALAAAPGLSAPLTLLLAGAAIGAGYYVPFILVRGVHSLPLPNLART